MSYSRWSDASDLYIFAHVNGTLCCCGCLLTEDSDGFGASFYADSTQEMVDHLAEHRAAGHVVPDIETYLWEDDQENFGGAA